MNTFLKRITTALITCLLSFPVLADRIEVIQLQGRSANDIIPIIQPLLDPDTGLSAQGYKLIVRGSEQTISQVRDLVLQLDHPLKQLMISLRRGGRSIHSGNEFSASGSVQSGNSRLSVNGGHENNIRLHESRRSINNNSIRRINVTEGRQAFIQTGQLVPVGQRSVDRFGNQSNSVRYKNASSGFYVLPRLAGDRVNLDILQNSISIDRHGRQKFNVQRTGTTLSGKIGEWISIGGVTQQFSKSGSGILHSTNRNSNSDSQLYIKVDVIN